MNALQVQEAQTFLFVPGNRHDRFDKAVSSGADVVIIDLEDAVAPPDKDLARERAAAWLAAGGRAAVRVNAVGTPWFHEDLAAVRDAVSVILPKANGAEDVELVALRSQGELGIVPLIETAAGVMAVQEICRSPGVVRLSFGNVDLANELGVDPASGPALQAARSHLVYASRAANLAPPIDGVTTKIGDDEVLLADARHARELGFGAKLAIHPSQVPVIATAFRPTEAEVGWATSVLGTASEGVGVHDGHMIDAPVLARARAILRRAGSDDPRRDHDEVDTPRDSA